MCICLWLCGRVVVFVCAFLSVLDVNANVAVCSLVRCCDRDVVRTNPCMHDDLRCVPVLLFHVIPRL